MTRAPSHAAKARVSWAKDLSDLLRLTSVLVAMDHGETERIGEVCRHALSAATDALRRAVTDHGPRHKGAPAGIPNGARPSLSPREKQIMRLLVRGASYKEIAHNLGLAFSTVQSRTKTIYAKLGVHGKSELRELVVTSVHSRDT